MPSSRVLSFTDPFAFQSALRIPIVKREVRLLRNQVPGWRRFGGRCRRNRERQPRVPARWTIRLVEFPICLEVQISLHVADGEDIADLWTHSEDTRSETTEKRTSASIVRYLLVGISNEADEDLF